MQETLTIPLPSAKTVAVFIRLAVTQRPAARALLAAKAVRLWPRIWRMGWTKSFWLRRAWHPRTRSCRSTWTCFRSQNKLFDSGLLGMERSIFHPMETAILTWLFTSRTVQFSLQRYKKDKGVTHTFLSRKGASAKSIWVYCKCVVDKVEGPMITRQETSHISPAAGKCTYESSQEKKAYPFLVGTDNEHSQSDKLCDNGLCKHKDLSPIRR